MSGFEVSVHERYSRLWMIVSVASSPSTCMQDNTNSARGELVMPTAALHVALLLNLNHASHQYHASQLGESL